MITVVHLLVMLAKVLLYVTIALAFAGLMIVLSIMPFKKKNKKPNA